MNNEDIISEEDKEKEKEKEQSNSTETYDNLVATMDAKMGNTPSTQPAQPAQSAQPQPTQQQYPYPYYDKLQQRANAQQPTTPVQTVDPAISGPKENLPNTIQQPSTPAASGTQKIDMSDANQIANLPAGMTDEQLMALFTASGGQPTTQSNSGKKQILDPNKDYGRTGKEGAKADSYNYSYNTKKLQNDLNREIMQYNADIASGKKPGTAADYITPLKADGYMGYNTIKALEKLGYDTSSIKGWNQYGSSGTPAQGTEGSDALSGSARQAQIDAINQRGKNMTDYYKGQNQPAEGEGTPEASTTTNPITARAKELNDMAMYDPSAYMAMAYGLTDPSKPAEPTPEQRGGGFMDDVKALFGLGDKGVPEWSYGGSKEPETVTSSVNGRRYSGVGNKAENPEKAAARAEAEAAESDRPRLVTGGDPAALDAMYQYQQNGMNRDDAHYREILEQMQNGQQRQPIEYSDAFLRQQDQMDAYSPNANYNSGTQPPVPVGQRPPTAEENAFMAAKSNADAYASQLRDFWQGLGNNQSPNIDVLGASTSQNNQFQNQFNQEFDEIRSMRPNMSASDIFDNIYLDHVQDADPTYLRWLESMMSNLTWHE